MLHLRLPVVMQAAVEEQADIVDKQLDFAYLQQLRCLELLVTSKDDYEPYTSMHNSMTVQLPPHLTRLVVDGNCHDLLGLQHHGEMRELSLKGCVISISRLAELLSSMPQLRDLRYDAYEFNRDVPEVSLEGPRVNMSREEEEQLATAVGGLTKLTQLNFDGLYRHESHDAGGAADGTEDGAGSGGSISDEVDWVKQLQGLRQLQDLDLSFMLRKPYLESMLQLSVLTALTYIDFSLEMRDA